MSVGQSISGTETVGQLVASRPSRSRLFEEWGIDYCCGGKRQLASACRAQGIELGEAIRAIGEHDERGREEGIDWSERSATELIEHIIGTHHAYLRQELPRLSRLVAKVASVHGDGHRELNDVLRTFMELGEEISAHVVKEEEAVFPAVRALESADGSASMTGAADDTTLRMLEDEHEAVGHALESLRRLTHGYEAPEDACNSYRAMLDGLGELERDTHQHIHKENNILFPKTAALRASLC